MIYSMWGSDGFPHAMVPGTEPPKFADGTLQSDCTQYFGTFEAESMEAACEEFDRIRFGDSAKETP